VIEDVIAAAGVSRGTFYNHFKDVHELMLAARDALVDEWVVLALGAVADIEEPDLSCAMALRVGLIVAMEYPLVARFHVMIGTNFLQRGNLVSILLPPLVQRGIDMGQFTAMSVDLAVDYLAAVMVVALQRIALGQPVAMEEVIAALLRLLGVTPQRAAELAAWPEPAVTPPLESLIVQSDAAMRRNMARALAKASTSA
jgi:AcrR family transcriptional regulator